MLRQRASVLITSLLIAGAVAPASVFAKDIVPVFKLKGPLTEQPDALGLGELFGDKAPVNMFDLLQKLREAASDDNVRGVVFDIEEAQLGFAQIQELRGQIEKLRAADKDVWIFTETLGPGRMILASAASRLVLLPTGDVDMTGLYGEASYYKRMLDKIGVEADILHCGAYKSAGEPFYLEKPSKESEQQTNRLLDSIFEQLVVLIAKSRKIKPDDVRSLVDRGILSPREALEAKLVDKLSYREDFLKSLKKNYGPETEIVANYGKKKGPEIDFDNPFAFFKMFGELMKPPAESDKPAIAVVYVEGPITQGDTEQGLFGGASNAGSSTVRKAIAQAAKDDNVKALILRVDSPGGSAIASDIICEATKRFKKSGRPFIVSMGNVAGSGGYYVATLADTIFAQPATITGSIGVVGGKLVTKGLWDWVGITSHEYKRGKHADIMNTNRRFTDPEREKIMAMMNRIYGEFKDRVLEGRKDRIKGDLEPLAGGRVYTGEQAVEIGLVDKLGGFADAIRFASSEADLGNDYELRVFPKPKTLMDIFAEAFGGSKPDDDFVITRVATNHPLLTVPAIQAGMETLQRLDPAKARAAQNFLTNLELLTKENVLLIGPSTTLRLP